jgi:hypothetical protein
MSFQAMAWAISQEIPRTCEKFLLVMLANYADQKGYCYPSVDKLSIELSQDRKTIIRSIKSLIEVGLLKDSGRRVGRTKGVIVYQLVGIPESSRFHYLYRLQNPETGEYYVGARSSDVHPHMDEYSGSGDWPRQMHKEGIFLHKEIIEIFHTIEECRGAESKFFRSMKSDDGLCRNKQASFYAKRVAREAQDKWDKAPKKQIFLAATDYDPGGWCTVIDRDAE